MHHKDLLRYSRDNNDNCEVAFVLKRDWDKPAVFTGSDDEIDFGMELLGENIVVLYNHPRNRSYSYKDIVQFVGNRGIRTITIVKNNGSVESLTKLSGFDTKTQLLQLSRLEKKLLKFKSDDEYEKIVLKYLTKNMGGTIEWIR